MVGSPRFRVHDYRNIAAFSAQSPHTVQRGRGWEGVMTGLRNLASKYESFRTSQKLD